MIDQNRVSLSRYPRLSPLPLTFLRKACGEVPDDLNSERESRQSGSRRGIDSPVPMPHASIDLQGRDAMPITNAIGEQVIEAVVAGPDGANRLFTITGAADVCIRATRHQGATETWTFLVGPILTRLQFHRAIATASVASQIVSVQTTPREFTVNVDSVEADWDDEAQRVNVRVEIGVHSNGATVEITQVRYWVAILAQM
jgi:hypothetical protein